MTSCPHTQVPQRMKLNDFGPYTIRLTFLFFLKKYLNSNNDIFNNYCIDGYECPWCPEKRHQQVKDLINSGKYLNIDHIR